MELVDTDVMIDLARGYPPALEWFKGLGQAPGLPVHVAMELMQGCSDGAEMAILRKRLKVFKRYYPTADDQERAEETFARCHLSHKLGMVDAIIGELAVGLGATLYTFNIKHYKCVKDLDAKPPYKKLPNS